MENTSARNITLDALKTLAALCVVFLHYNHVGGYYGEIYTRVVFCLTTFAVPFFFMTTGYFIPQIIENRRETGYLKKICTMALCSTAFYFVYYSCTAADSLSWVKEHYTIGSIVMWLTGQDDPAGFHLWYFYCLMLSFIFVCTIMKHFKIVVLYIVAILIVVYHISGMQWFSCYTQSIPALAVGVFLFKKRDKIIKLQSGLLYVISICTLVLLFTYWVRNKYITGLYYEGHIMALLLFVFAMRHPVISIFRSLGLIGLKYSAYIYIFHVFINSVVSEMIAFDNYSLQIVRPFVVFAISLLLSLIYVHAKGVFKVRKLSWNT